jgi:hypothetical protein
MTNQKVSVLSLFKKSYSVTVRSLQKNPRIFIPFLVFAVLEALSFIFLYLAPREPLRAVMGPIIKTMWGEQFLHYPRNFLILPKLAGYARMVLSVLFGSILTGVAIALLYKKPLSLAFHKFVNLMVIILLLTGVYYFLNKAVFVFFVKYFNAGHEKFLFIGPRWWLGAFSPAISLFLGLILQAIVTYAIPILLTTEKKFIGAMAGSFMFFIKNPVVTLLLVGIPLLISVPLIFLNYNAAYLMGPFSPEIILWLGFLGIIVNSLILDPLITLTTATFYLEKRAKQ